MICLIHTLLPVLFYRKRVCKAGSQLFLADVFSTQEWMICAIGDYWILIYCIETCTFCKCIESLWCKFPCVHKTATKNFDVVWKGAVGFPWIEHEMRVFDVRDEHITCHIPFTMFMPILNHQMKQKDQDWTQTVIDHSPLLQGQKRARIHKRVATPNS